MDGETLPSNSSSGPNVTIRPIASGDGVWHFKMEETHSNLALFLQKEAIDHHNKHVSKTYVLLNEKRVLAYISLCCAQIKLQQHLEGLTGYKYSYPAVKIGKLAVHEGLERKGHGSKLVDLTIAIAKDEVRSYVGCRFILVDSHQKAIGFYQKKGFVMIDTAENRKRVCPVLFLDIGKL
jgi:GNAT superfamily N-acetyltransferase